MKTRLSKKDIKKIEKETVFSVEDLGDDGYSFAWYTDAGEDFSFEVSKGIGIIDYIKDYCFNFDVEEHVKLWFGANRGEPSLLELVEDAQEIQKQLGTLACVVDNL